MNQPYLSVIVPAFNEVFNFKKGRIDNLYAYLSRQKFSCELICVDDGSTDNTTGILADFIKNKPEATLIKAIHRGKGSTVVTGLLAAKGQNALFTDFDQATPIAEVEKLLPFIDRGYDVVIGSREVEGAKREKEPLYRHIMGKGFNLVVKIFIIRGISDTQCGFKLLTANAVAAIVPKLVITRTDRPRHDAFTGAFDVEILFIARELGLRIAEVPVSWQHFATTRVSPIKDSVRMIMEVIRIRAAYLLGSYTRVK